MRASASRYTSVLSLSAWLVFEVNNVPFSQTLDVCSGWGTLRSEHADSVPTRLVGALDFGACRKRVFESALAVLARLDLGIAAEAADDGHACHL